MNASISLGVALVAGLLSAFSPCILPLVPVYIGYLAGQSVNEQSPTRGGRILHALLFVLGFGAVFVALGATAGWLGGWLARHLPLLVQIGGLLLILLGMHMTGILHLPALERQRGIGSSATFKPGYGTSVLVGALFALGWTPCVGPVLAGVLVLAADAQTVARGSLLLGAYALGLGVPFIALAAGWDVLLPLFRRAGRWAHTISVVSGALLIVLGILMLTGLYNVVFGSLSLPGAG
ncbi:MAG: cytochrome c biogenesis CcdA family protein [Anaerolineae bacterium]